MSNNELSRADWKPLIDSDRIEQAASVLLLETGSEPLTEHILGCLSHLDFADIRCAIKGARGEIDAADREALRLELRHRDARDLWDLFG